MRAAELDLDLDVFAGPFDLLMAVVLREEVSLAEVSLGEIVVAYVEHLESAGELDLDAATEFLVLIASLLELKSRLLLPAPRTSSGRSSAPRRRRTSCWRGCSSTGATGTPRPIWSSLFADGRRYLYRIAPLPPELRRASLDAATQVYEPEPLAQALGDLLRGAARAGHQPHPPDRLARAPAAVLLRDLLSSAAAASTSTRCSRDEDRLTQAVTLFALLEMHKRGEASWTQKELFGPIEVEASVEVGGGE